MKNYTIGRVYSCTSPNGCIVHTKWGYPVASVPAEGSRLFVAIDNELLVSDPDAIVMEVKNGKPLLLGELHSSTRLPAGYKQVAYLESTGTQYIISNVIPGEEIEIKLEYFMSSAEKSYQVILGVNEHYDEKNQWRMNIANNSGQQIMAEYGWWENYRDVNLETFFDAKKKLYFWAKVNYPGIQIYEIDNVPISSAGLVARYPKGDLTHCSYPLGLFARKRTEDYVDNLSKCKIYSLEIKTNGQNYHFIPCIDRTGAPCMFDLVSRKPFYNSGSGDFLYPGKEQEASTFSLRRPVMYAQLTRNGVRRLYKVPTGYNGTKEEYAAEHGFKPIVEPEQPEEGYWAPVWTETAEEIVLEWVETDPPMDEFGLPDEELTETE